ncbi:TetR/AcrR family transcriptional regulator [Paenibacillus elgii]|uniref:TetR/AcrR family transcriptional regulator n=1 Tax=Paenibacillus elgii TaxID=189691 RepID=UPI000FD7AAA8|nr:TetR/AcrR family transcriptional regulator [Paenibacillus elgii]NEN84893.1 TetR/AcrR family transcriptional regulator [Paenibacillus elgii]
MEEDVRVYKTKKSISEAFVQLLHEKDFSHITVKDICTRSLTSKSTFYSHFLDKYDLLEKLVKKHVDTFEREIARRFESMKQGHVGEVIETMIDQAAVHKREIGALLNVHVSAADLRVEFEAILYDACFAFLDKEPAELTVSIDYLAQLYAANAMALLHWTLQNGKDASAIALADSMQRFIFDQVRRSHGL